MQYLVVDAFTRNPFQGNPAAVVFLDAPLNDELLQDIAVEFNLSETAFLKQIAPGNWHLRWFTPGTEIDLCGHATLASAHAIWETGRDRSDILRFETLSGELRASRTAETVSLQFPIVETEVASVDTALLQALALEPVQILKTKHYLLLELADRTSVENFVPDVVAITNLPARGLIITAENTLDDGIDFVTRFFAPRIGVPEDPVTGAVHCALAPYWSEKLGKTQLVAKQLSARTGVLHLTVERESVVLAGPAVTVMRGELTL